MCITDWQCWLEHCHTSQLEYVTAQPQNLGEKTKLVCIIKEHLLTGRTVILQHRYGRMKGPNCIMKDVGALTCLAVSAGLSTLCFPALYNSYSSEQGQNNHLLYLLVLLEVLAWALSRLPAWICDSTAFAVSTWTKNWCVSFRNTVATLVLLAKH